MGNGNGNGNHDTIRTPDGTEIKLNPGSGPVEGAQALAASVNMAVFVKECAIPDLYGGVRTFRIEPADEGGRYAYLIRRHDRCALVLMPGLPLERVRYTGEAGQHALEYTRLHVNGQTWLWRFAMLTVQGIFESQERDMESGE